MAYGEITVKGSLEQVFNCPICQTYALSQEQIPLVQAMEPKDRFNLMARLETGSLPSKAGMVRLKNADFKKA